MPRAIWVCACLLLSSLLLAATTPTWRTQPKDDAIRTVRTFDMLVAYPRATLLVGGPQYVSRGTFSVGGEVLPGLFLHPTGSVVFPPVRVAAESLLTFKIGMIEAAWDKPGDGVEFVVFVRRSNDSQAKVFSRYIDPKHNRQDRRWFEERVSLRPFAGQDVRIMLSTEPGPAEDFSSDWAVWADPQIVLSSEN
jgi:hypothetical protein